MSSLSVKIIAVAIGVAIAGVGFFFLSRSSAVQEDTGATSQQTSNGSEVSSSATPVIDQNSPEKIDKKNMMHYATIETSMGVIKFKMYDSDAPKTVENFKTLADKGFYNGLIFHRVVKGFVIQGGDPRGDGTGGPGYTFEDELSPNTPSAKEGYKKGVVAMANAGPNTNGSQFFIMLEDNPLPHNYTIFGKVVAGQDVVDAIGRVPVGAGDRPQSSILMKKVAVTEE